MRWDNVQKGLRDSGHLIYAMDQAQTAPMTEQGPWGDTQSGYCLGLATRWIQLRLWGQDFVFDADTKECTEIDWRATVIQNVAAVEGATDLMDFWEAAAEHYRMELNPRLVERLGPGFEPSGAFLNHLMIHAVGCYGITLQGVGGAHAIAGEQAADGTFHLFDANYGHFQAADAEAFRKLVDWFFAMTGYDTRYKRGALIVGVDL